MGSLSNMPPEGRHEVPEMTHEWSKERMDAHIEAMRPMMRRTHEYEEADR